MNEIQDCLHPACPSTDPPRTECKKLNDTDSLHGIWQQRYHNRRSGQKMLRNGRGADRLEAPDDRNLVRMMPKPQGFSTDLWINSDNGSF